MITKTNIFKAITVSAIVSGIYTFYISSSVFIAQTASWGEQLGRLQSFIRVAEITENFWPHVIKGWGYTFGLLLLTCLLLLAWVNKKHITNR